MRAQPGRKADTELLPSTKRGSAVPPEFDAGEAAEMSHHMHFSSPMWNLVHSCLFSDTKPLR
jgi:hypothetical protein